jgi:hypothetical protein
LILLIFGNQAWVKKDARITSSRFSIQASRGSKREANQEIHVESNLKIVTNRLTFGILGGL